MLCMIVLILLVAGARTSTFEGISDSSDIECPPTPDWYDPQDSHGSFFQERYQGVKFEAPDRHYFDASGSIDTQSSTSYSQHVFDPTSGPLDASFQRLSHGACGSSRLHPEKPKKRVTFAPEVYIFSESVDRGTRTNTEANQPGASALGRGAITRASSSQVSTSSDAYETESEDEAPDSAEFSEEEEDCSEERTRVSRNRKATMSPQEKEEMRKRLIEI